MKNVLKALLLGGLCLPMAVAAGKGNGNGNGHHENNGNQNMPNGRPFQMLRAEIEQLTIIVDQQIEQLEARMNELEGRVDAVEEHNATQDELIDQLQMSVGLLERRVEYAEDRLAAIDLWQQRIDRLIQVTSARIDWLWNHSERQDGRINYLYRLYQAQNSQLLTIQRSISTLQAWDRRFALVDAQHSRALARLGQQLNQLRSSYSQTALALASGCPAGSSIRAISSWNRAVTCEADDQGQLGTLQSKTFTRTVTVPPGHGHHAAVFCPTDYQRTGGGIFLGAGGLTVSSVPVKVQDSEIYGWYARGGNFGEAPIQLIASVVCTRLVQ